VGQVLEERGPKKAPKDVGGEKTNARNKRLNGKSPAGGCWVTNVTGEGGRGKKKN